MFLSSLINVVIYHSYTGHHLGTHLPTHSGPKIISKTFKFLYILTTCTQLDNCFYMDFSPTWNLLNTINYYQPQTIHLMDNFWTHFKQQTFRRQLSSDIATSCCNVVHLYPPTGVLLSFSGPMIGQFRQDRSLIGWLLSANNKQRGM